MFIERLLGCEMTKPTSVFPLEGLGRLISPMMRQTKVPIRKQRSRINFNSGSDYLHDK